MVFITAVMITALTFILMVDLLIVVHEAGHMLAAKRFGAEVIEVSVGLGPVLFEKKIRGTAYTIRFLPIGGFCHMMDNGDGSALSRAVISLAGPLANLALGFAGAILMLSIFGYNPPLVGSTLDDQPVYGVLMEGDLITHVDGHRVFFSSEADELARLAPEGPLKIRWERDGRPMSGMLSADDVEGRRNIGAVFCQKKERCRPQELLPLSAHYVWSETRSIYLTVANILKGKPVVRVSDFVSKDSDDSDTDIPSAADILELIMAFFFGYSVKAGAANLLPLPSLDGGHIVLAVLEGLTGISMDRIRPVLKKIAVLFIMGSAIRIILSGSG